ncbi:DNA-binding transcriptional LysR family regulator [Rhizobium petrolearium]|uniref:LysR family transcriptional regulator n=1 Tax=Neorhizobium petrolearium TaxID=515361 RepID=UPI001AE66607|nr:LysR family transcriptional regulator [Neorhizobium petrolearium]MBP1845484.1 DNA-binding transcriptional LysR family regulator [Neorhizobium petrolearium]
MHPRQLKTFLAIARHGNLTRAASEANLAQSSLSDQVQALEAELGTQLLLRSRQGVVLTPSGEVLKAYAEEILALNEDAKTAIRAVSCAGTPTLTIGTLETIAAERLTPFLARFRHLHPDLVLTLKIAGSGELQRRLEEGLIDVAITFDRGGTDKRFVSRLLSREPLALIAAVNASVTSPENIEDLACLPFIATETGCVYRRLFDTAFDEAGVGAPKVVTQADSIATIIRLVASGVGCGLVPRLALGSDDRRADIIELPWPGVVPTASMTMVWRRRRIQPPALSHLVSAASDGLRSLRPADDRLQHEGQSLS